MREQVFEEIVKRSRSHFAVNTVNKCEHVNFKNNWILVIYKQTKNKKRSRPFTVFTPYREREH